MIKVSEKYIGIIAVLVYFVSQYCSDVLPAGQLLTLAPLAVLSLLIIRRNGLKFRKRLSPYLIYMYGFTAFCAASMLWAADSSLAIGKMMSVLIAVIGMTVIYLYSYNHLNLQDILTIMMYGGYISVFIISLKFGWIGIRNLLSGQERMSSNIINSNTLGMCMAYTLVINIYFIIYGKKRLTDILIIPAVIIVAISGSRKALMIMVGGVFALLVLKNLKNRNLMKLLFRALLTVVLFIAVLFLLNRLKIFSNVMSRMNDIFEYLEGNAKRATNSAWLRFEYIKLGWKLFKMHPILGIGIGNASIYTMMFYGNAHYLHNNYMEMLACGGLVGFFLHYWIFFHLLRVYIKKIKHHDKEFDICFVLLVLKLIMDMGAVSYYAKPTYFYLFLFVMGAYGFRAVSTQKWEEAAITDSRLKAGEVQDNAY